MRILAIALALLMPFALAVSCEEAEPLVTLECTDATDTSLAANALVNKLEGGSLVRRGFVFMEGTTGTPSFNTTPIVNPSFEEGDPPEGWLPYNVDAASESSIVRIGSHSLKLTTDGSWARVSQGVSDPRAYRGKTMTFGVWARASSDNDGRQVLILRDSVDGTWASSYSPDVPKDDAWHWITVSRTIRDQATDMEILLFVNHTGTADYEDVVYFDAAVLAQNAVFEDGGFSTGDYSLIIRGLKPDTSYRVTAFVVDAAGVRYGNTLTCRTAQ